MLIRVVLSVLLFALFELCVWKHSRISHKIPGAIFAEAAVQQVMKLLSCFVCCSNLFLPQFDGGGMQLQDIDGGMNRDKLTDVISLSAQLKL